MIDRFERFSLVISDISRYWHKIASDEMTKYGLKGNHAVYLVTMYRFPEGLTAANLSELCGKDKADVSRAMTLMEKKGLIEKKEVNKNSYRALLKLTADGEKAAEQVREKAQLAVKIASTGVSDEHRQILYNTLEIITTNLQKISREGL